MSNPVTREVRAYVVACENGKIHGGGLYPTQASAILERGYLNRYWGICGPHSVVLLRGEVAGKAKRGRR
jgi:hypothetical protein